MKRANQELVSALFDGNIEGVRKALSHHANPNTRIGPVTPLLLAVILELPECVGPLIRAGAKVNARESKFGHTPLHYAGMGLGGTATIKALIKAGANVNAMNDLGLTPLDLAAGCRNECATAALTDAGGRCNDSARHKWVDRAKGSKPRSPNVHE